MTTENNSRDNSVFIKESRSAHSENMKTIILRGIIITIITVFLVIVFLPYIGVKAEFVLMCAGVFACVFAMAVNIIIEIRNFRSFTEFIYGMDENEFNGLNSQAVSAGRDFDIIYMLDKYIYLCPKHVLIPYYDIKDAHFSTAGILSRKSGADFYVYCHSGKKFIVNLDGNYFKYRGSEDTFESMLNSKIRKS